jgi:hypothetical protein
VGAKNISGVTSIVDISFRSDSWSGLFIVNISPSLSKVLLCSIIPHE